VSGLQSCQGISARFPLPRPIFSASNDYINLVPDQIQWFFQKIAVSYHLASILRSVLMLEKHLTRSLSKDKR